MDTSKYKALVYASPAGCKLRDKVEKQWCNWLQTVEDAPWLEYFKNYRNKNFEYDKNNSTSCDVAVTPCGAIVAGGSVYPHHEVASYIYSSVVWSLGVEGNYEATLKNFSEERLGRVVHRMFISKIVDDLDKWLDNIWQSIV